MIKKIITAPINLVKSLFYKLSNFKIKKKVKINLEDIALNIFDTYGEKIMFKLEIGTNGDNLIIYSSNYKTTLEKAKKAKKEDNEKIEKDDTR